MSLVSTMNIAQQALAVSQAAITVTSNNIANVDTPGYSKLRANQAEVVNNTPSAFNKIALADSCSGVTISNIERYSNNYLQKYYWQQNSTSSYLGQYSSVASNVQDLVNELNDTGLSSALENFYDAVNALTNAPSDITARENYIDAANNVCSVFNSTSKNLNNIKESLVGDGISGGTIKSSEISSQVADVNNLLDQIADVNKDIIKTNNGSTTAASSALLDKRDSLVSSLSALMPVNIEEINNGTVSISLGNYNLVQGADVKGHLEASATGDTNNPVKMSIVDPNDASVTLVSDVTDKIDTGSIGAILDICGSDSTKLTINGILKSLDTMASEFADVLNEIQIGDPKGDNTVAMAMDKTTNPKQLIKSTDLMFVNGSSPTSTTSTTSHPTVPGDIAGTVTTTAGGVTTMVTTAKSGGTTTVTTVTHAEITAANIQVNSNIVKDPYLIAAARVSSTSVTDTSAIGNNANMQLVTDARTNTTYYSKLGGTTIEKYLASTVSAAGSNIENLNSRMDSQKTVLNAVQNNLQSEKGVNLDEELTDLMKYQRAYEAAARIISVCNDIFENLVNLGK